MNNKKLDHINIEVKNIIDCVLNDIKKETKHNDSNKEMSFFDTCKKYINESDSSYFNCSDCAYSECEQNEEYKCKNLNSLGDIMYILDIFSNVHVSDIFVSDYDIAYVPIKCEELLKIKDLIDKYNKSRRNKK